MFCPVQTEPKQSTGWPCVARCGMLRRSIDWVGDDPAQRTRGGFTVFSVFSRRWITTSEHANTSAFPQGKRGEVEKEEEEGKQEE